MRWPWRMKNSATAWLSKTVWALTNRDTRTLGGVIGRGAFAPRGGTLLHLPHATRSGTDKQPDGTGDSSCGDRSPRDPRHSRRPRDALERTSVVRAGDVCSTRPPSFSILSRRTPRPFQCPTCPVPSIIKNRERLPLNDRRTTTTNSKVDLEQPLRRECGFPQFF